ncbi:MAG: elongation factor P, partial [Chlamydiota bacterium]
MTTTSNQISPGTTLSLDGKIYRVETSVKVTVAKGVPFIKTKLKNLMTDEVIEKNFKLEQAIEEVALSEQRLEFLYLEGKGYLFLDIDKLDEVLVSVDIVGDKANYL